MDFPRGALRIEMIPENQGATVGMKDKENDEAWAGGRRVERRVEASRSWIWSVSA